MLRSLLRRLGLLRGAPAETQRPPFKAGDLVSVVMDEHGYGVAKVLAVDEVGVHVRLYVERLRERPSAANLPSRSLRPPKDGHPLSAGHLPLTFASFARWEPSFIVHEAVGDNELEGFRIWDENRGGYF